jgi:putative molybdopterin biosynthesis protein
MEHIETSNQINQFKVLGDERRVKILRYLMAEPATLSQLGEKLGIHPANVRYHLKQLEVAGLVTLTATNVVRGFVEKYYQASARAYQVSRAILPESEQKPVVMITGSHDLALDLLAQSLRLQPLDSAVYTLPIGSMDGLIALRQGIGQMAGVHLFDSAIGEYNLPFVRHLFPDQRFHLVTLAHRQQGLIVAGDNPLNLQSLKGLAQANVRFVNRRRGSGTRLWFDQQLELEQILPDQIGGYDWEVNTHLQVAEVVAHGRADAGIGLEAAARRLELGFVPLFEERYDLVILEEDYQNRLLSPALDFLQTSNFRQAVSELGGYNTRQMGVEISV